MIRNGNGKYKFKDNKEFQSQSDKSINIHQILDQFVTLLLLCLIFLGNRSSYFNIN